MDTTVGNLLECTDMARLKGRRQASKAPSDSNGVVKGVASRCSIRS